MRSRLIVVMTSAAFLIHPARAVNKAPAPDPSSFAIDSIDYSGTGCPSQSLAAAITADAQSFIFIFSKLYAQAGPGVGANEANKRCQIHLKLTVPPRWSYAIASVDYHGYAALDSAVRASQQTTYHMSGESPDTTAAFTWQGSFDDVYVVGELGSGTPPYWSRCGGGKNLMITTTINVDNAANAAGSGLLEVDDADGQILHVSWQQCR